MRSDRSHFLGAVLVAVWLATPATESSAPNARSRPLRLAQAADSYRVIISEVLFAPAAGETTFVELTNVGVAVDLSSFVLRVDTLEIPLPRLAAPLAGGARALIRFDGRGTVENNVFHASAELRPDSGSVTLLLNDERPIDRVAWGAAEGAIMPPRGGIARGTIEPGSSFGRPPGADRPGSPNDWVIYPPEQVTPGQPNPLPAVVQLLPMDGAILPSTTVNLSWYTVSGATRYRVQLAVDTTFAQPLLNQLINEPPVSSGQLAAGTYWWRVQAIAADGQLAAWSRPNRLDIDGRGRDGDDAGNEDADPGLSEAEALESPSFGASAAPVLLNVPLLVQHKDSPMLLLESQQSGGPRTAGALPHVPHTWDGNHQALDVNDPADNMNCGLASMAMLNRFYNGDLTQDRIGYEVFSKNINKYAGAIQARAIQTPITVPREKAVGPERDLNYGYGVTLEHLVAAGLFALGALPGAGSGYASTDDIWKAVRTEIDAGHPLIGFNDSHLFVIRGYELRNGERLMYVNDPWSGPSMPGQYAVNLDASNRQLAPIEGYFSYPIQPGVAKLEANFWKDSDRDDVSDFDEINRFQTNPNHNDSDNDGVHDKQDIESGIYEEEHTYGYAWNPAYGNPGRDLDMDGKPTELDPDSDDGGCKDGDEDTDADGYHNLPAESGNFDRTDDECGGLDGSVSYVSDLSGTDPNQVSRHAHYEGTIRVRLKPESPGSDLYLDDGSSFWAKAYARQEFNLGNGCIIYTLGSGAGSGTFEDTRIGATRGDDGSLAFSAEAMLGRVAQSAAGGCNLPGGTGKTEFGMSFPDCPGQQSPKSPPGLVTYRFNCNTTTNTMGLTHHLVVKGYIRLKPPPSPQQPLGAAVSRRTF